jgi:plasmid stabilization system protein ParE
MRGYRLSVPAQEDLSGIFDYYFEEAGYGVARGMITEFVGAFRAIARNQGIDHRRQDLAGNRPILFWLMRDYLILYRTLGGSVEIVMIVHGSRDIARLIKRRKL